MQTTHLARSDRKHTICGKQITPEVKIEDNPDASPSCQDCANYDAVAWEPNIELPATGEI